MGTLYIDVRQCGIQDIILLGVSCCCIIPEERICLRGLGLTPGGDSLSAIGPIGEDALIGMNKIK